MPGEASVQSAADFPPQVVTESACMRRGRYLTAAYGLTGWAPHPCI